MRMPGTLLNAQGPFVEGATVLRGKTLVSLVWGHWGALQLSGVCYYRTEEVSGVGEPVIAGRYEIFT